MLMEGEEEEEGEEKEEEEGEEEEEEEDFIRMMGVPGGDEQRQQTEGKVVEGARVRIRVEVMWVGLAWEGLILEELISRQTFTPLPRHRRTSGMLISIGLFFHTNRPLLPYK